MPSATGSMVDRMKGAARLDAATYRAVEHDERATGQAAGVVALVAVAQVVGSSGHGGVGILAGVTAAVAGWLIWAAVTWAIGDKLLGGTATWGELLRTLGYAQSPGVLFLFAVVPLLGPVVRLVLPLWILVAGVVALREALDFGLGKVVLTAVLGWLTLAALNLLVGIGMGGGAAM